MKYIIRAVISGTILTAQDTSKYQIDLKARNDLEVLIGAYKTPKTLHDRARIIVGLADGKISGQIAFEIGIASRTVFRCRK